MDDGHTLDRHAGDTVSDTWSPARAGTAPLRCAPAALSESAVPLPAYLQNTYSWAYLNPVSRAVFDQSLVVSSILWGNANRLIRSVLLELQPGQSVLQTACVYGSFSARLARHLGRDGRLDVIDVAPIQVRHTRRKLRDLPQASVRLADAVDPGPQTYDAVCCFFLIHEVPADYKRRIVSALLDRVEPGGTVIFVDYHRPARFHPLRPVIRGVFALLEPYATEIWATEIADLAPPRADFSWTKQTFFGGMYQKVIARRAS